MKKEKRIYPFWLSVPALLIYTVFIIVPIIMSFGLAFTDWNIYRLDAPEFSGIRSFKEVLKDPVFLRSMGNTFLFSITTTVLKIVFGLALALVLVKPFRGNGIFRTIFYLPCVLSMTVIGVLFTAILSKNGLVNQFFEALQMDMLTRDWLGQYGTAMFWVIMIESWMWAGFNMFIFISGIQAIPSDYYEAASTEGASKFQQFLKITMPLLVPAITVNATLNIAGGMKVFDIVYVLTNGGPGTDTQVLNTFAYRAFGKGYLGESCAASIILTCLVMVISFALNRFLRKREVEA